MKCPYLFEGEDFSVLLAEDIDLSGHHFQEHSDAGTAGGDHLSQIEKALGYFPRLFFCIKTPPFNSTFATTRLFQLPHNLTIYQFRGIIIVLFFLSLLIFKWV